MERPHAHCETLGKQPALADYKMPGTVIRLRRVNASPASPPACGVWGGVAGGSSESVGRGPRAVKGRSAPASAAALPRRAVLHPRPPTHVPTPPETGPAGTPLTGTTGV